MMPLWTTHSTIGVNRIPKYGSELKFQTPNKAKPNYFLNFEEVGIPKTSEKICSWKAGRKTGESPSIMATGNAHSLHCFVTPMTFMEGWEKDWWKSINNGHQHRTQFTLFRYTDDANELRFRTASVEVVKFHTERIPNWFWRNFDIPFQTVPNFERQFHRPLFNCTHTVITLQTY